MPALPRLSRLLPVLGLSAALLTAGCTDPYGRMDWGRTAALGVGVAAVTGLAIAASNGGRRHDRGPRYSEGYGRGGPGWGGPGRGGPGWGSPGWGGRPGW
ncbi:hypothetical protein M0638_04675 [Roseomonas sp. NAR14]|uniref:Lipoprotein n=1 Tax=Roseomonas acroporae TaxID=2937791 RepID=A0A9X1YBW9_9PROT|nr:hypothetical protein [Roseomonas acroporae]MCK8783676.1 hypothetical protein [Roseomonas acroporae]